MDWFFLRGNFNAWLPAVKFLVTFSNPNLKPNHNPGIKLLSQKCWIPIWWITHYSLLKTCTNIWIGGLCGNHVLHQLMPAEKINSHNLRERSYNFTIPLIVNNMMRKNFLYRLLFIDMY